MTAGTVQLKEALASIEDIDVTIDDVALRAPKLDEVFLALTGQPLEDETQPATTAAAS